jgi:hypothetical protein
METGVRRPALVEDVRGVPVRADWARDRANVGQPRTFRPEPISPPVASRDADYRRLTAVILGLDVPALALDLRTARRRLTLTESRAA